MSSYRDHSDRRDRQRDRGWTHRPESYRPGATYVRRDSSYGDGDRERASRRDRGKDDRLPPHRQASERSPTSHSSPIHGYHTSSPRCDPHAERNPVTTPSVPVSKPLPAAADHPLPRDITNFLDILSDRYRWSNEKDQAIKKLEKIKSQRDKLAKAPSEFVSQHVQWHTQQKEAEALKQRSESQMMALDPKVQQELLLFLEKHQKHSLTAVALDTRMQKIETAFDNKVKDRVRETVQKLMEEHQAKESELSRLLDEESSRNKRLEEKLGQLATKVDETSKAGAEATKQVSQLQKDIDIPSLNEMKERLDSQERQLKEMDLLRETLDSQKEHIADLKLQQQNTTNRQAEQNVNLKLLQSKVEPLWQLSSSLEPVRAKVDSQEKLIADLKSWQEEANNQPKTQPPQTTDLEPLRAKMKIHEQKIENLYAQKERANAQAQQGSDLEPLRAKVGSMEQQIMELNSQRPSMEGFWKMLKDVLDDIKSVEGKVSKQEAAIENMDAKVQAVRDKVAQQHASLEEVKRQLSHEAQMPSSGTDTRTESGSLGSLDNALQSHIRAQVEPRLKQSESEVKARFDWLAKKIGQMIDDEGTKLQNFEKSTKENLSRQAVSLEDMKRDQGAQETELESVSNIANHVKLELGALQTIQTELQRQLNTKTTEDNKIFEDLGLRIRHLNLWRDNFNTAELARAMVTQIANAIPSGTQEHLRNLNDRVANLEVRVYNATHEASKKRKMQNGTSTLINGHP